jgi:hypothetical protein
VLLFRFLLVSVLFFVSSSSWPLFFPGLPAGFAFLGGRSSLPVLLFGVVGGPVWLVVLVLRLSWSRSVLVCLVVLRGLGKGRDFLLLLPLLRTCRDGKPQPAVMANLNLSKPGLNLDSTLSQP